MAKTSFRLDDETSAGLAQLAEKCHNGNRTAALVEAIRRYQQAVFSQPVGWVQVRIREKIRCASCNNPIETSTPGYVRLAADGRLEGRIFCQKCAK